MSMSDSMEPVTSAVGDVTLLDEYMETMEEMDNLQELIIKMKSQLNRFGALHINPPLNWKPPVLPVHYGTGVKVQEKHLLIAPFADKDVLWLVQNYHGSNVVHDIVQLQDDAGKVSECADFLKNRTTIVKLHRDAGMESSMWVKNESKDGGAYSGAVDES